jgi:uncharacterized protein
MKDLGFVETRVRHHDTVARIELPRATAKRAMALADQITVAIKAVGYTFVALDLEDFRSGSMNRTLEKALKEDR